MDNIRSRKIILVSHCILNQNSVVEPLARAKGAFGFIKKLIESGVGIIQLPCPEFRYLGIPRKPMDKDEYDTPEYRKLCRELCNSVLEDLLVYLENGYEFKGIIGINKSPTCSITENRGIFMEELFHSLSSMKIKTNYFEVPDNFNDADYRENFYYNLEQALKL